MAEEPAAKKQKTEDYVLYYVRKPNSLVIIRSSHSE